MKPFIIGSCHILGKKNNNPPPEQSTKRNKRPRGNLNLDTIALLDMIDVFAIDTVKYGRGKGIRDKTDPPHL